MVKPNILKLLILISILLASLNGFLIQLTVGKAIQTLYGNSAQVWITCMVFFTLSLVIGYLYAYLNIERKHFLKLHVYFCIIILTIYLVIGQLIYSSWLPIVPFINSSSSIDSPVLGLLFALVVSVLGYYLVLSSNTIVMNQVYLNIFQKPGYFLYSISNIGSLLGLICYPFIFEALIGTVRTSLSIFVSILALILINFIIYYLLKSKESDTNQSSAEKIQIKNLLSTRILIVAIGACISTIILVSSTTFITFTQISAPFIWMVILAIYLASYILGFAKDLGSNIRTFLTFMTILFGLVSIIIWPSLLSTVSTLISLFGLIYLIHNTIYTLRPEKENFKIYYLAIAIGGAVGSLISGILFPIIYSSTNEYLIFANLIFTGYAGYLIYKFIRKSQIKLRDIKSYSPIFEILLITICTGIYILAAKDKFGTSSNVIFESRNFYGAVKVFEADGQRYLTNGEVIHGNQMIDEPNLPTAYYGKHSPVSFFIKNLQDSDNELELGLIGLGVGTLSTYCRNSDNFVYFEINPLSQSVAKQYFNFLERCKNTQIILGDARKSIHQTDQKFDAIIVDAFSGDGIPQHLITTEAINGYFAKLKSPNNGVVGFHLSNMYIDLKPILREYGKANQIDVIVANSFFTDDKEYLSEWVFLSNSKKITDELLTYENFHISTDKGMKFTDDLGSLIYLVRTNLAF